jgi:hypothetical protein
MILMTKLENGKRVLADAHYGSVDLIIEDVKQKYEDSHPKEFLKKKILARIFHHFFDEIHIECKQDKHYLLGNLEIILDESYQHLLIRNNKTNSSIEFTLRSHTHHNWGLFDDIYYFELSIGDTPFTGFKLPELLNLVLENIRRLYKEC